LQSGRWLLESSKEEFPHRLFKVLGLPVPFPTST
jgi:hypothetical protein